MVRGKRITGIICAVVFAIALSHLAAGASTVPAPPPHISVAVRRAMHEVSRGGGRSGPDMVAALSLRTFPRNVTVDGMPLPTVMTAVGIAESDANPTDLGDRDTPYLSVGIWQIRLIHKAYLGRMTGSQDPAVWIRWLQDPEHNAQAAAVIYRHGGLAEWGAWTDGRARLFLPDAERAMAEVASE